MCMIGVAIQTTVTDKRLRSGALWSAMLYTLTGRQGSHGMRRRTWRVTDVCRRWWGGSVSSMMKPTLKPLHGASVMVVMVTVAIMVSHTTDQMGVAVGVLKGMQRGPWQSGWVGRAKWVVRHPVMVLPRNGAFEGIASASFGLHDFYHI